MTMRELKQLANKMTQWQHALTSSMGPLFSDPLRTIKRTIKQAEERGASGRATTEDKVGQKDAQQQQRVEKRKRAAEDGEAQKRTGARGEVTKEEQSAPASEKTEYKSGPG